MLPEFLPLLRNRLTFLYVTSSFLIFLLLSSLFSIFLWIALHNQIDHHVHLVTTQAQQIVTNFQGDQQELLLDNLVQMEGMSILVAYTETEVVFQKHSADIPPLISDEIRQILQVSEATGHHPIHYSLHGQRFGTASVMVDDKPALLMVGYSTEILQATFYQITGITVAILVLILIPLTVIGYSLLKKYLHPLEVVAQTAKQINHPKKLSKRVTGQPLTKEVATIISSFNEMLARLEKNFQGEHEFFSDVAHTLKTPLAVLRAKVEGLNKESTVKKQELLTIIDRAVATIQDILLISRIETGNEGLVKKINLSAITRELVEIAESLSHERKIQVVSHIQQGVFIQADERLITKALGNVVHNALQYVNDGGLVEITLDSKNDKAIFVVSNTGSGIDSTEIPHIFERFYRGKNTQKELTGSGLGLSITKAVVDTYGGTVSAESDENNRVTLRVII